MQTPKSPKAKNHKLQSGSAGHSAATKNFRRQVPTGQIETNKSLDIVKNAYNTASHIRINGEGVSQVDIVDHKLQPQLNSGKVYLSDMELYKNRLNPTQTKGAAHVGPEGQQVEDVEKRRSQLQQKLQHAQQNKNLYYTNGNSQITKLAGESN